MNWYYEPAAQKLFLAKGPGFKPTVEISVLTLHDYFIASGLAKPIVELFFFTVCKTLSTWTEGQLRIWLSDVLRQATKTHAADIHKSVLTFVGSSIAGAPQKNFGPVGPKTQGPPHPPTQTQIHTYNEYQLHQQQKASSQNQMPGYSYDPSQAQQASPKSLPHKLEELPITLMTRCGCTKQIKMKNPGETITLMLMGDVSGFIQDEIAGAKLEDFAVDTRTFRKDHKRSRVEYSYEDLYEEFGIATHEWGLNAIMELFHRSGILARALADRRAIMLDIPTYVEVAPERKKKRGK
jgi:hypothetical protein